VWVPVTRDIYIAMPVYRGTEHITETVESIRSQSYERFRVVMSIDGADDPTLDLCRTFTADDRFEIQVQAERLGWPGNFNWLANNCDSEFFCYWQQDDLASADYLQDLRTAMSATPRASVAYADVQWFGHRTDRVTAVDIDGTPLQRFLQAAEALQYVPLRGLIRTENMPKRADPIPRRTDGQPHQDFVFLAELAGAGAFRRVDTPLYYKRAHSSSAHHGWSSDPADQRREEWCALGDGLIGAALRTEPAVDVRRLVSVLLDRLAIARDGRGFWYLPEQTEQGVSAFVREFFYRYPERLPDANAPEVQPTGFERPVHRWVQSAITAVQHASATLDSVVDTPDPSMELDFGLESPSVWMLGYGWSTPEPWGTWTDSGLAELKLPPHTFRRATVIGHPFAPKGPVRVGVSAVDGDVVDQICDGTTVFSVDLSAHGSGEHQRVIRFHTPDAVSPLEAGVSPDVRRLGFGLCSLTLEW
jgi:glycosyltransferase involved in cell wall biosynthesis